MKCIHAKLNCDKTDYISSLEKIKSDDVYNFVNKYSGTKIFADLKCKEFY